jgi:alginate O-acetyltransferase complex protein AlgI
MPGTLTSSNLHRASTPALCSSNTLSDRARPNVSRFLLLIAQLALLLGVFRAFRVEEFHTTTADFDSKNLVFFVTSCIVFATFAVHYWLPFRFKEVFWIGISLLSTAFFFPPRLIVGLLGFGTAFYLVLSSRMPYRIRILIITAVFGAAMAACAAPAQNRHLLGSLQIPSDFWPIFGSIFMFRLIIYAHDVRYMKDRPSFREFLAYFFILPNFYFQLFPVIDYKTMRMTYYQRDIHDIAQQGITWICRGTLQLILYQVVNSLWNQEMIHGAKSLGSLLWIMLLTFLLYLRVSGVFHIVTGMLHLFGYDLPETHHKYLLSRSLSDFWRRINIYWKDFMVKIVYFPVYFKFRKTGELRAKLFATAAVFVVTWALHSYQSFWLGQTFGLSWPDTLFWTILGGLVMVETWLGNKRKTGPVAVGWRMQVRHAASVAATGLFIITIWSFWNSPTIGAWLDLIRWWHPATLR